MISFFSHFHPSIQQKKLCFLVLLLKLSREWKNSFRTVLAVLVLFYAHDNYITLEKAKLLIIEKIKTIKMAEEKQKPVNDFIAR